MMIDRAARTFTTCCGMREHSGLSVFFFWAMRADAFPPIFWPQRGRDWPIGQNLQFEQADNLGRRPRPETF